MWPVRESQLLVLWGHSNERQQAIKSKKQTRQLPLSGRRHHPGIGRGSSHEDRRHRTLGPGVARKRPAPLASHGMGAHGVGSDNEQFKWRLRLCCCGWSAHLYRHIETVAHMARPLKKGSTHPSPFPFFAPVLRAP